MRKSKNSRKKKALVALAVVVAVVAIAGGVGAMRLQGSAIDADAEAEVFVPTGADYATLVDSLEATGVVASMTNFALAARALGLDGAVRPGHYVLEKGMSYRRLVKMFQRGLQTPVRLTFNNIRTLPQLAGRLAGRIEPDSVTLAAVFMADTTAARYGFDRETFIAMFIPDTYEFYWNISPTGFLDRMKREYDTFWDGEREAKLRETGLTRVEAVTLASIVYEETKMSDEMPTVAGVYINRLRVGMPLQADPTVKFAVGDFTLRRVLDRHKDAPSLYNTYVHAGLPPGPICMPSVKAIDAVLDYGRHRYLFFCARPDFSGYHSFAVTLAEHNRNAAAYHRALDVAGIR